MLSKSAVIVIKAGVEWVDEVWIISAMCNLSWVQLPRCFNGIVSHVVTLIQLTNWNVIDVEYSGKILSIKRNHLIVAQTFLHLLRISLKLRISLLSEDICAKKTDQFRIVARGKFKRITIFTNMIRSYLFQELFW